MTSDAQRRELHISYPAGFARRVDAVAPEIDR
jgi:hypothetical protein